MVGFGKKMGLRYAASQLFVVVLFGFLYWLINYVERNYMLHDAETGGTVDKLTFFDAMFFSLVTQTTVGYGTVVSRTYFSKIVNFIQLLTIYGVLAIHL